MSQPEKKRRSGRTDEPGAKLEKTASRKAAKRGGAPIEHDPNPTLHSPWVPLIWLLVPLIACVIYGIATR